MFTLLGEAPVLIDKDYTENKISKLELEKGYTQIIDEGAVIIEADLGLQAGKTLEKLWPAESSKQKYLFGAGFIFYDICKLKPQILI